MKRPKGGSWSFELKPAPSGFSECAARQGGLVENRKASAEGLRAREGKQAWRLRLGIREALVSRARRQDRSPERSGGRRAWRHHGARRTPERERRRAGLRSPEGDKGAASGLDYRKPLAPGGAE